MDRSRLAFILSTALLLFTAGVAVGAYKLFPYGVIKQSVNSLELVISNRDEIFNNEPTAFLAARTREGSGLVTADPSHSAPGVTLLSGFFDNTPGLRLVDSGGQVLASWPTRYEELFPDSQHIQPPGDIPASDWNAAVHGMELLEDGSVVFNLDGKGTVKLDRCGELVWRLNRMTHHSIDRQADGSFWIPSRYYRTDPSPYPLYEPPFREDTILHISRQGKVLSELPIVELLIENGLFALLAANGRFKSTLVESDILHINDVETLKPELAHAFPQFNAGNLMLSFRHLNMLIILDPQKRKVLWYQSGPWHRQHDPDFEPDGKIVVFNNNSDDTMRGHLFGGSRIDAIQPDSPFRIVSTLYGKGTNEHFFTNTQGKHQRLDNGNRLIAEYYAGRVFEIDSSNSIVWEYINAYDDKRVARISGAKRYPPEYLKVTDWTCPSQ